MDQGETIIAYKGFEADWTCRGFKYEIGKTYTHDGEVSLCNSGFHACEYPLDVFGYYPPTGQIAHVELKGAVAKREDEEDSKRVAKSITIKAALSIAQLVAASFEYKVKRCEPANVKHAEGDRSASSTTGDWSASSATGDRSASSTTGYQSASSATGDQSASSATGDQSASSATGDQSASSATGYQSASSATGDQSASSATGYQSASSATGDRSASSATGYRSASSATGKYAVAAAFGLESKAMAGKDGTIIVAWWDDKSDRVRYTTGYVGEGIKPDVWYRANTKGELVEA